MPARISWQILQSSLLRVVAVEPVDPERGCLSMETYIYCSRTGGDSWIHLANVLGAEDDVSRIGIAPQDPFDICAAAG